MVIHPPMLYLGYVGFIAPFAFAIASLATKQPGDEWIKTTRRWTLVTWMFQTTGVLLGMGWAYAVLGWGGYWGWDPVENASLLALDHRHRLPALRNDAGKERHDEGVEHGAGFLHLLPVHLRNVPHAQRRGAICPRVCGRSPSENISSVFLAIGISATVYLILSRLEYLKSESQMESVLSRESSFMFNNLILLASCFAVLWGTLFPVITEAIKGEKISVDKPFFNRVNIPIGMFLLLLTGVGPLIAWRRSSFESLKRAFLWPALLGPVRCRSALFAVGIRSFYALMSFGLCAFVLVTVAIEFFKGARAISGKSGSNLLVFDGRADASQHTALRRIPGAHGHRDPVHRIHGQQPSTRTPPWKLPQGGTMQLGAYTLKVGRIRRGQERELYLGPA